MIDLPAWAPIALFFSLPLGLMLYFSMATSRDYRPTDRAYIVKNPQGRLRFFRSYRMNVDAFTLCPAHARRQLKPGQLALLSVDNCTRCNEEKACSTVTPTVE